MCKKCEVHFCVCVNKRSEQFLCLHVNQTFIIFILHCVVLIRVSTVSVQTYMVQSIISVNTQLQINNVVQLSND